MDVRVARLYVVDYAFIVLAFGLGGVVCGGAPAANAGSAPTPG